MNVASQIPRGRTADFLDYLTPHLQRGVNPSRSEMARAMGWASTSQVGDTLRRLVKSGHLERRQIFHGNRPSFFYTLGNNSHSAA